MLRTPLATRVALVTPAGDTTPDARVAVDAQVPIDAPAATGCAASTALFCEDFESLELGEPDSDRWTTENDATIDDSRARGTRALHIHTVGNGRARMFVPFAPPGNSFFGRAYIYVSEFPSAPAWSHFTLVEATGPDVNIAVRPIGGQYAPGERAFWGIGSDGASGDWTDWRRSAPAESGRWLCMGFELDDLETRIDVSIDGVVHPDLHVEEGNHAGFRFPTFDRIWFGWWNYQGGTTPGEFDVWFDDIVLDDEPIGCDP